MNDGEMVAFLNARLDEDEAAAYKAATADRRFGGRPHWSALGHGIVTDSAIPDWAVVDLGPCIDDGEVAEHIARHDPARVLREVAFKRAILALHMPQPFWGNNPPPVRDQTPENVVSWYCECQCPDGVIEGMYPCGEARLLVSVYSGHPDYRAVLSQVHTS